MPIRAEVSGHFPLRGNVLILFQCAHAVHRICPRRNGCQEANQRVRLVSNNEGKKILNQLNSIEMRSLGLGIEIALVGFVFVGTCQHQACSIDDPTRFQENQLVFRTSSKL